MRLCQFFVVLDLILVFFLSVYGSFCQIFIILFLFLSYYVQFLLFYVSHIKLGDKHFK